MRVLRLASAVLVAAGLAVAPASPGAAAPPAKSPAPPAGTAAAGVYLALGDSVAAGVGDTTSGGYPARLSALLGTPRDCARTKDCAPLRLENRSISGATTTSLIDQQLPGAVKRLQQRNGNASPVDDVRLVTVTIGGNDVVGPVLAACFLAPSGSCDAVIAATFQQVQQNLATILGELRSAAGPRTTIAVMLYYNAFQSCVLSDFAPQVDGLLTLFNGLIAATAGTFDAVPVATSGLIGTDDLVGGSDCLHPDDSGHQKIAEAFGATVGPLVRTR
jgi:lysophospholipase L1-like esterase